MGEKSKSAYGGGFLFRMVVLLVLLGLVVGGFYYDKNKTEQAAKTIDKTMNLISEETDDGHGLPKDRIQEAVGFAPSQTRTEGDYEIETYRFSRVLPFVKGEYLEVVYEGGELAHIFANEDFASEKMKVGLTVTPSGRDAPMSPMAGGAPSGGGSDEEDTVGGLDKEKATDDADDAKDDDGDDDHKGDGDADDAKDDDGDDDHKGDSDADDDHKGDGDADDGDKEADHDDGDKDKDDGDKDKVDDKDGGK